MATYRAMVLHRSGEPLRLERRPLPKPGQEEILIKVHCCGVCRTDLHLVDGELPSPKLPVVPGHEIVGEVVEMGEGVEGFRLGQLVGVPWLGWTCGRCRFCRMGRENLCDEAKFTGYTLDGGYAEYAVASARYCFPLPQDDELHLAPLLCAGLIGYRSYRMVDPSAERIGLYGFGAAAHIICQIAVQQGKAIYAFTRPGDDQGQRFALELGAVWAGDSHELPLEELDAAIIYAPVGTLVPQALRAVRKGGQVICAGIQMSDIPTFPYRILWGERSIASVANLTREDGKAFFEAIRRYPVKTEVNPYPLEQANEALEDLRKGRFKGAAVLVP